MGEDQGGNQEKVMQPKVGRVGRRAKEEEGAGEEAEAAAESIRQQQSSEEAAGPLAAASAGHQPRRGPWHLATATLRRRVTNKNMCMRRHV